MWCEVNNRRQNIKSIQELFKISFKLLVEFNKFQVHGFQQVSNPSKFSINKVMPFITRERQSKRNINNQVRARSVFPKSFLVFCNPLPFKKFSFVIKNLYCQQASIKIQTLCIKVLFQYKVLFKFNYYVSFML